LNFIKVAFCFIKIIRKEGVYIQAKRLALKAAKVADDKKGYKIIVLDLRALTDIADYFVICSGDSDTHTRAISDHIIEELKQQKEKYWHREGYDNGEWILLDYGTVVIHVFENSSREFYDLERLWGDADVIFEN
jgi:ribosome-associated protein